MTGFIVANPQGYQIPNKNAVILASPATESVRAYSISSYRNGLGWFDDYMDDIQQGVLVWLSHSYIPALVTAPLVYSSVLTDLQLHPNPYQQQLQLQASTADDILATNEYQMVPSLANNTPTLMTPLRDDVIGNIRHIVKHPHQGGLSCFLQGHMTGCIHSSLYHSLQPLLEETLNELLDVYDDVNPITFISTSALIGGLLSPMELARTRFIAHTKVYHDQTYSGTVDILTKIPQEEKSSFLSLYSPRHLMPSLFIHTLTPLLQFISAYVITEELDLSPQDTPIVYHAVNLCFKALQVAIITPFEMARRRLQIQRLVPPPNKSIPTVSYTAQVTGSLYDYNREYEAALKQQGPENECLLEDVGSVEEAYAQPFYTCIQVSKKYYMSVWDVFRHVVREEGGTYKELKRRSRTRPRTVRQNTAPNQPTYTPPWHPYDPTISAEWDRENSFAAQYSVQEWRGVTDYPRSQSPSVLPPSPTPSASTLHTTTSKPSLYDPQSWYATWIGFKSLYRSFYPTFMQQVVLYIFKELKKAEEW